MIRAPLLIGLGLACAPAAFAQAPAPAGQPAAEDEIIVEGRRTPFGSIPGDLTPITTLSPADVRASGAATVAEALAAIAPQTGAAGGRGGGRPAVLVNGRRIAAFQEIRDLPAEAIARIEVFDEQAGLQYGFPPDQRVVNIVLRRRYQANTVEVAASQGAEGNRDSGRAEANHLDIQGAARTTVSAAYEAGEDLSEAERGVFGAQTRSLLPEESALRASAAVARALTERTGLSFSLRAESGAQTRSLGSSQGLRDRLSQSLGASLTLDGQGDGWQWTATASADLSAQDSETMGLVRSAAASDSAVFDLTANASGPLFSLPAGSLRLNGRFGLTAEDFASQAYRDMLVSLADLSRETASGRLGVTAPLTSRRRDVLAALGDFSLNGSVLFSDVSDLESPLEGFGYGLSWSLTPQLRLSLQAENTEAAPTLRQRGDPLETTPNARFYDFQTGQSALIALVSGGNPLLGPERREDLTFNLTFSPEAVEGLTLTASWARNDTENSPAAFPATLPEAEAAFPDRFQRNSAGDLTAVDLRPVSLASRETAFVRFGLSYNTSFGEAAPPSADTPPWGQGLPPWGTGSPPWGSGPPPWAGGGGGGDGGGRRAGLRPGRLSLSLSYRERLADDLVLVQGAAPIDLVERGGLDAAGEPAGLLEFQSWVSYRGVGLRVSGAWSSAYETPGVGGVGALSFSDRLAVNARVSVALDRQPFLIDRWPSLRGVRVQVAVDNLTDSAVEVRDASGQTPLTYQEAFLNPSGRVFTLNLRRQF